MLDKYFVQNPLETCSMQGEVLSYDLLQNDKYGRLDELKKVLESSAKNLHDSQKSKASSNLSRA